MGWNVGFRSHLVTIIIDLLMRALSPDLIKGLADSLIDIVEKAVQDSDSDLDDKIALPICSLIRSVFNIPDE